MDIWGRCEDCARWFNCSRNAAESDWRCPVCASSPDAIVNRNRPDHAKLVRLVEPVPAGVW